MVTVFVPPELFATAFVPTAITRVVGSRSVVCSTISRFVSTPFSVVIL